MDPCGTPKQQFNHLLRPDYFQLWHALICAI